MRDYCANFPYLTLHRLRASQSLRSVYVPLIVRPSIRQGEQTEAWARGSGTIADLIRDRTRPHVLITGEPGTGKSTLLRYLAEHAWAAPDVVGLDTAWLPLIAP